MAMKQINMPPGTHAFTDCLVYGDTLSIHFVDPGYFWPSTTGIFTPDLPSAPFPAGVTIGPYTPVANNTQVDLGFFDFSNKKVYVDTLKIKSTCP